MRIMSFAKQWEKLGKEEFSTFRYPRKDKDWTAGEKVQVFIKNRSPHRLFLGLAEVTSKEHRVLNPDTRRSDNPPDFPHWITDNEAAADGFNSLIEMEHFMIKYYGRDYSPDFNKLILRWISR
jgi:hypothetical protein